MALNNQQQAFVHAYVQCWNATKAALAAGYSAKTAYSHGSRLLKDDEINQAIEEFTEKNAMKASEALSRLAGMARGDVSQFALLDIKEIANHPDGWLIKKIKKTTVRKGNDILEETIDLELYDAQSALMQITKNLRLDEGKPTENIEFTDARERLKDLLRRRKDG